MDKDKFDEIIKHLENLHKRIGNIETILSTQKTEKVPENSSPKLQKKESFREFYLKYGPPKKETDKALVIFNFLESRKEMDNITIKEISQGFREVREMIPKNISDKMQMLHKSGFVSPRNGLGRARSWEITMSGLNHLEKLKNE